MGTLRQMISTLITLKIITISVWCQGTTNWRHNEVPEWTRARALTNTRHSQSVRAGIGVLFPEHGKDYKKSMRVRQNKSVHNKVAAKRVARHIDGATEDSKRRDERKRLLEQRYRLFREKKLNRKQRPFKNEETPRLNIDQQDTNSSVYKYTKRPRSSTKIYSDTSHVVKSNGFDKKTSFQQPAMSESENNSEKNEIRPRSTIKTDRQQKENHKPKAIYRPYAPTKPKILQDSKTDEEEELTEVKNKNQLKIIPDNRNFQDYKSKHRERLKILRERHKYKTVKSKLKSRSYPKRNKINLETAPTTMMTFKNNNESSKTTKGSNTSRGSQTTPTSERHLSEMTTRSPFLVSTRALDYLTSFESVKKPKRWPVRLLLPAEGVQQTEKSPTSQVHPSSTMETVNQNVEALLGVSERLDNGGKRDISTREFPTTKRKRKRNRKGSGNKTGKKKSKRSNRKSNKGKTKKQLKKRKRHLKKRRHLKTTESSISSTETLKSLFSKNPTEAVNLVSMKVTEKDSNVRIFSSIVENFGALDGSNSTFSSEENVTAHSLLNTTQMSNPTIHYQTREATEDTGGESLDDNVLESIAQINRTMKNDTDNDWLPEYSTDCQNSINCVFTENSEFNDSSIGLTNSSFLSQFQFPQNVSSEPMETNNVTESLMHNSSLGDHFPIYYSENGNDDISKTMTNLSSGYTDTDMAGTNQLSSPSTSPTGLHSGLIETKPSYTIHNPSPETNLTITSRNNSSDLKSSASEIPLVDTTRSSTSSPSYYDSSSLSSQFYSSRMTYLTFPSTQTKISSSPSTRSPSSSSSPSSTSYPLPSSTSLPPPLFTTTKATMLRSTQSSISRWRQWALKRRQKINQGKKNSPWGRRKSGRKWGSKKNNKNDNTKKYVQGRGSVAGSLVVVSQANKRTTESPTSSTKTPFIGHKTAYDFLSGQKGIRKVHGNEERRESYELNRLMAENMCETFDRHFVPTNIGGKCV